MVSRYGFVSLVDYIIAMYAVVSVAVAAGDELVKKDEIVL
jgi:hypothetical protein